ncbi:MAG: hypothetical protein IJY11_01395 [Clostridia bacterium]|nr:hypothetical protein [Clostridia bacterium]
MRICFVSSGGVEAFLQRGKEEKCDVTLFCFEEKEVEYEEELNGKTHLFEDVASLSKRTSGVVVCGAKTKAYGQMRNSAIVAQKGKILGVADMTRSIGDEVVCGAPLKVFDTVAGKIGVIVADDLYFPETAHSLTECGADTLVCPLAKEITPLERVLFRATAFFYGVPILFCGRGSAGIADYQANESFYTPFSPVETVFERKKQYALVSTRRRIFRT